MPAKRATHSALSGAFMERIPDNVLLEPIEYIFADHCRQADLCEALKAFAERSITSTPDPSVAAAMLHSIDVDLGLHIADEELDLFPRLRTRATPDDHFAELLRLLDQEHERDRLLADAVREGLVQIANHEPLADPERFRRAAASLVSAHISHLNWENAVVLPLARKRLTDDDLQAMTRTMSSRRAALV